MLAYCDPGRGTDSYLYFPAAMQPVKENAAGQPQTRRLRHERVMNVDDAAGLVSLGTRMLERLGSRFTEYADPEKALVEFRARPTDFDAVVTDLAMPRMSGLEFAREVLAIGPESPVWLYAFR